MCGLGIYAAIETWAALQRFSDLTFRLVISHIPVATIMEEVPKEMPNLFRLMVGKKEQKELLSQRSCLTQEKR